MEYNIGPPTHRIASKLNLTHFISVPDILPCTICSALNCCFVLWHPTNIESWCMRCILRRRRHTATGADMYPSHCLWKSLVCGVGVNAWCISQCVSPKQCKMSLASQGNQETCEEMKTKLQWYHYLIAAKNVARFFVRFRQLNDVMTHLCLNTYLFKLHLDASQWRCLSYVEARRCIFCPPLVKLTLPCFALVFTLTNVTACKM